MHTKTLSDIYQTVNFSTKKSTELEKKLIELGEDPYAKQK